MNQFELSFLCGEFVYASVSLDLASQNGEFVSNENKIARR
jgi:hypothetical protein